MTDFSSFVMPLSKINVLTERLNTLNNLGYLEILLEKPCSASSFPETVPHRSRIIFRDENEAKVPPGAAFGDLLSAAVEGKRSLVRKERVVGPARGPTKKT